VEWMSSPLRDTSVHVCCWLGSEEAAICESQAHSHTHRLEPPKGGNWFSPCCDDHASSTTADTVGDSAANTYGFSDRKGQEERELSQPGYEKQRPWSEHMLKRVMRRGQRSPPMRAPPHQTGPRTHIRCKPY
jgi:hypothetical protein